MVSMQSLAKAAYYSLYDCHTNPSAHAVGAPPVHVGKTMQYPSNAYKCIGLQSAIPIFDKVGWLLLCLFLSSFILPNQGISQQEPQFTKYMFNTLSFNPGYAGSKGYLSIVALHREQWFGVGAKSGINGRPVTQTFSAHTTLNKSVGLGINLTNDQIGSHRSTIANISYAYRIAFGKGILSLGLQAGAMNWKATWADLDFKDAQELDNAFNQGNPNEILPDFGAGIYFSTDQFYVGTSLPHLVQFSLRDVSSFEQETIRKWSRNYRHFYFTAGGAVPINGESLVFRPSLLIKTVGFFPEFFKQGDLIREIGSPTTFDIDASFLFSQKLWLGTSFRSAFAAFNQRNNKKVSSFDSIDFWGTFLLKNGARIGFAYDFPLNEIVNYSQGSFELMLGFDFYQKLEKINSPRYF